MTINIRQFFKFAAVSPSDEERVVCGIATSEAIDDVGDIIDRQATERAWQAWASEWGNIREMHQPSAVGRLTDWHIDPEGRVHVCVKIIDDQAWKKVKTGVYRGFSIGGEIAPNGTRSETIKDAITGLWRKVRRVLEYYLEELSLVDKPANPEAVFLVAKMSSKSLGGMGMSKNMAGQPAATSQEAKTTAEIAATVQAIKAAVKSFAKSSAEEEEIPPAPLSKEDTPTEEGKPFDGAAAPFEGETVTKDGEGLGGELPLSLTPSGGVLDPSQVILDFLRPLIAQVLSESAAVTKADEPPAPAPVAAPITLADVKMMIYDALKEAGLGVVELGEGMAEVKETLSKVAKTGQANDGTLTAIGDAVVQIGSALAVAINRIVEMGDTLEKMAKEEASHGPFVNSAPLATSLPNLSGVDPILSPNARDGRMQQNLAEIRQAIR